jgi:hypothetical protein
LGRTSHLNFRGRRSLSQFERQLECKPVTDWSPRLREAWRLLTSELALPHAKALSVIRESVSAGHRCVREQNKLLSEIERARTRAKLQKIFDRVFKGIKRAPADLRRRLDQQLIPLIQVSTIDLEVIESIFEGATTVFEEFTDSEATSSALRALRELRAEPFSRLGMPQRRQAEKAIANLASTSNVDNQVTALQIFGALAEALQNKENSGSSTQARGLVTSYVRELAVIWRRAGLKPTRVYNEFDHEYVSHFHWFADDVLAAMTGSAENRPSEPGLVYDDDVRTTLGR